VVSRCGEVQGKGFLIRFLLGLAGSLAALSLLVGWTISSHEQATRVLAAGAEHGSWASPAELDWLKRLGAWNKELLVGLQSGRCPNLTTNVGVPPTRRLERAFAAFRRACSRLRHDQTGAAVSTFVRADELVPPGEHRDLPVIAGLSAESRVEPRFGGIASKLAGKPVEVRCWSSSDWPRLMREESTYTHGKLGSATLGFAGIGGKRINLAPAICDGLVDLADRGARPVDESTQLRLASALVTLAHEPQHSKGIAAEAVAECNAIELAPEAAAELGVSREYAASLVQTYWRHYGDELPQYQSSGCRKGGALDLHRADSIWP
jgi:hypothetical protein